MKRDRSKSKREQGIVTPKQLVKRTRIHGVKFRDVKTERNPAYGIMKEEARVSRLAAMAKKQAETRGA